MSEELFGTVIDCIDGRCQDAVNSFLKRLWKTDFIDVITMPAPVKIISDGTVDSVKDTVRISIRKHGSKNIAIVAHFDCAGNPVSKTRQLRQLKKSVNSIKECFKEVNVIGVWVGRDWKPMVV